MANGSVESKGESNVWPDDDAAQSQPSSRLHRDPSTPGSTPGDPKNSPQAAHHLPPLPQPRPPSPVSVAELQERAVMDSQNNNVDENSNDRHVDQYAAAAYPGWEASAQAPYPNQEAIFYPRTNEESSPYPAYLNQEAARPPHASREASSHLHRRTSSLQSREASHSPHSSHDGRSFQPDRVTTHPQYPAQEFQEVSSHHFYPSHSSQGVPYPSLPSHPGWEAASHPDQSVRPRVRLPPQYPADEPDRSPLRQHPTITRRDSEHHRHQAESTSRYPPLPNLHQSSDTIGSHNPHSSQELLPYTLRGGDGSPQQPLALRSTELVTVEAEQLLNTFTSETLRNNRLEVPQWMQAMPSGSSSSPHMMRAGRELRLLADAFADTAERRKVRDMAESVNLGCIQMDDFFHLCTELFYDGITRERIVALFTFVGDVAVHQVKLRGEELIHRLMKWSLKYLVEHVCRWVQEAGGWVAVLTCGANFLYRCAVFVFCVCGSVAAGLFIYKTLKDG
ncbi:Bcl-2-like protein 1 [Chionoecetes opilio]|uniref:Bcl-2-like protein 1 n=1 Tax=Chionoecetes opilio TaxID=41210 RepID=A0A8J4XWW1_CHIOP|nr:Bcl-2-like protein 1 [Chionoecetes opilio]